MKTKDLAVGMIVAVGRGRYAPAACKAWVLDVGGWSEKYRGAWYQQSGSKGIAVAKQDSFGCLYPSVVLPKDIVSIWDNYQQTQAIAESKAARARQAEDKALAAQKAINDQLVAELAKVGVAPSWIDQRIGGEWHFSQKAVKRLVSLLATLPALAAILLCTVACGGQPCGCPFGTVCQPMPTREGFACVAPPQGVSDGQ